MIGDQPLPAKPVPARWRIVVSMVLLLGVVPATLLLGERWMRPDLGIAPRARPWMMQDVAVLGAAALVTGAVLTWLIRDTGRQLVAAHPIDQAKPPQRSERTLKREFLFMVASIGLLIGFRVLLQAAWSYGGFQPGSAILAIEDGIKMIIFLVMGNRLLLPLHASSKPARPRGLWDAQLDEV